MHFENRFLESPQNKPCICTSLCLISNVDIYAYFHLIRLNLKKCQHSILRHSSITCMLIATGKWRICKKTKKTTKNIPYYLALRQLVCLSAACLPLSVCLSVCLSLSLSLSLSLLFYFLYFDDICR